MLLMTYPPHRNASSRCGFQIAYNFINLQTHIQPSAQHMNEAVALNNRGVRHLRMCQHGDAISMFRQALMIARQLLPPEPPQARVDISPNDRYVKHDQPASLDGIDDDIPVIPLTSLVVLDDADDNESHFVEHTAVHIQVYRRAIVLPQVRNDTDVPLVAYCFVYLFNLAIANHLHAMSIEVSHPSLADDHFAGATLLYGLAQELLLRDRIISVDITIFLALANNQGALHKRRDDAEESHRCFVSVQTMLMLLLGRTGGASVGRHFEGFFVNVANELIIPRAVKGASAA